ncbi:hypothetical protein [Burkholderia multivorans]|uniref:hypothetical protein n=1 Tax=Burkholderia multivorans TaxID=87883 RepID=UPI0019034BFC|nr:hypothetical protein [Burkholderia multivorans]MBJ9624986.1 hypothetical protein [Burkholderia multivorans]
MNNVSLSLIGSAQAILIVAVGTLGLGVAVNAIKHGNVLDRILISLMVGLCCIPVVAIIAWGDIEAKFPNSLPIALAWGGSILALSLVIQARSDYRNRQR